MRTAAAFFLALVHAVLVLALSYTVGTLLGAAWGHVDAGRLLGLVIGLLALVAFHRQPEPGRIARYFAALDSVHRMVPASPYLSAGSIVFAVFLMVVLMSSLGAVVVWFLS